MNLVRARHQVVLVSAFGLAWVGIALLSVWLCQAVAGPVTKPSLFWFHAPHVIVIIPWGLLLLCIPSLYSVPALIVVGLLATGLDAVAAALWIIAAFGTSGTCTAASSSGCVACDVWAAVLSAGFTVLGIAWLAVAFNFATDADRALDRAVAVLSALPARSNNADYDTDEADTKSSSLYRRRGVRA